MSKVTTSAELSVGLSEGWGTNEGKKVKAESCISTQPAIGIGMPGFNQSQPHNGFHLGKQGQGHCSTIGNMKNCTGCHSPDLAMVDNMWHKTFMSN